MSAQQLFKTLVVERIAPLLNEHGFKKSGLNWHRKEGEDWLVVNVQKSAFSDRGEVRFTMNLGVGLTSRRGHGFTWPDGKRPPITRCHHQQRIGELLGETDRWWDVRSESGAERAGRAAVKALEETGLPWLESDAVAEANEAVDERERTRAERGG